MKYLAAVMVVTTSVCGLAAEADVDDLGVRKFSAVPPVGVHPRVLLSPEDLPAWREHVIATHKGKAFFSKRYQSKYIDRLAETDPAASEAELVKLFPEAGPVHDPLFAVMDAVYHQDKLRAEYVARALTTFGRVLIARSTLDPRWGKVKDDIGGVKGLRGIATGLGELWFRGGQSFALAYDFLYDQMTAEQRSLCRKALATATRDLVSWGMGFPKGRAVSNWYTYHGELGLMLLAIEGEEGFDKARYEMFTQMVRNWVEVSLHPDGGGNEDGYQANTGLREGTFAMIAMARRGENLFRHPNYLPYWKWLVYSLIPGEHGGRTVSYACNAATPYESMPTLSRWAVPGSPLVNCYYRQFKGQDYSKNNHWQYSGMSTLFAMDWEDTPRLPAEAAKLGLPLTAEFGRLGLMITRSDWSDECLYLNFYCRQDAWMDRHENVDRGRFVICAGGRQWIGTGWNNNDSAANETIVHIDGKSQRPLDERGRMIVPNGNMIARADSPLFTAGCMDLKRCYDWQWCNSFTRPGDGWEAETSTFAELGWIWQNAAMPKALNGADDPASPKYNFAGFNFWRKLANPVRFAFRTCALAHGPHPYVIVIDDVQKDDQSHRYQSVLQVPDDVQLSVNPGGGHVLGEIDPKTKVPGPRKMLLRLLGGGEATVKLEDYEVHGSQGKLEKCRRVVIDATAISPDFKVLLYPFRDGQALPIIAAAAGDRAMLEWSDQKDEIRFARQANGLTRMKVLRGDKAVFAGFDSFSIYPSAVPGGTPNR